MLLTVGLLAACAEPSEPTTKPGGPSPEPPAVRWEMSNKHAGDISITCTKPGLLELRLVRIGGVDKEEGDLVTVLDQAGRAYFSKESVNVAAFEHVNDQASTFDVRFEADEISGEQALAYTVRALFGEDQVEAIRAAVSGADDRHALDARVKLLGDSKNDDDTNSTISWKAGVVARGAEGSKWQPTRELPTGGSSDAQGRWHLVQYTCVPASGPYELRDLDTTGPIVVVDGQAPKMTAAIRLVLSWKPR